MNEQFPRNLRYSPLNWLIVDWGFNGQRFEDCGLPKPLPCPPEHEDHPTRCTPLPIREAIDTYDWERFLPEVMVGIDEPDEDIAANYIREAAIDFATRARVLQRQIYIPLQKDVCTYPLEPYDDEQIIGVIGLALDDETPCGCSSHCSGFMPNGIAFKVDVARNELHLEQDVNGRCSCQKAQVLRMLVWSAPSEDSCAYDQFLYNRYRRAITIMARRNYIQNVHFRDNALMRVLPSTEEYERLILSAKKDALAPHSWSKEKPGSGMWQGGCFRRRSGRRFY